MSFFQATILAVVQGLTEFLPISSSGHLVLFQKLFWITTPSVFFDILFHLGTLVATLWFFRKNIIGLIDRWQEKKNIWFFLIVGSVPAAIFGYLLNSKIEQIFDSLFLVAICWVIFGLILLFSQFFYFKKSVFEKKAETVTAKESLIIGFFQAMALLPGMSRSGLTIIGALFCNFSRQSAFELSFLLSIPAILGAVLLKLTEGNLGGINFFVALASIIVSAVVGYLSLKLLQKVLESNKFYYFGFYCLALGVLVLLLSSW